MFFALFVALALPSLQEQWQWLEDECYVVAKDASCLGDSKITKDASCLGDSKGRCSVRVALSSGPVCAGEVCNKRQRCVYYTASDDQDLPKRCA